MTKTHEVLSETVRNPKHAFKQAGNCPGKPRKHRYERRKIREVLRGGEWSEAVD